MAVLTLWGGKKNGAVLVEAPENPCHTKYATPWYTNVFQGVISIWMAFSCFNIHVKIQMGAQGDGCRAGRQTGNNELSPRIHVLSVEEECLPELDCDRHTRDWSERDEGAFEARKKSCAFFFPHKKKKQTF